MKTVSIIVAVKKKDRKTKVYNKLGAIAESAGLATFRQICELVSGTVEQVESLYLEDGDEILSVSHAIF